MLRRTVFIAMLATFGQHALAGTQLEREASRGEMLYSTHCIACHDVQVHWRDNKLVHDWTSLLAEVRRWARNAGLGWDDDDVTAVARYLNTLYYNHPVSD